MSSFLSFFCTICVVVPPASRDPYCFDASKTIWHLRQETIIRRQASILVELTQASQVAKSKCGWFFLHQIWFLDFFPTFSTFSARPPLEFARHTFRSRACCPWTATKNATKKNKFKIPLSNQKGTSKHSPWTSTCSVENVGDDLFFGSWVMKWNSQESLKLLVASEFNNIISIDLYDAFSFFVGIHDEHLIIWYFKAIQSPIHRGTCWCPMVSPVAYVAFATWCSARSLDQKLELGSGWFSKNIQRKTHQKRIFILFISYKDQLLTN